MLILKPNDWFDLNKLGLVAAFFISIFMLFFAIEGWIILALETCLFFYGYFLYRKIKYNKSFTVLINQENKWFVRCKEDNTELLLNDYWILKGHIFIWLKGSKNSISLMLSRSIIGANKFSQIRAQVK